MKIFFMETLFIPTESDFKKWIKEAVKEFFQDGYQQQKTDEQKEDGLLNRKEIAKFLRVSLVTLTDWMKRGLPCHKQRGRVYFDKEEVLSYIREKKIGRLSLTPKFHQLKKVIV
jgi:predicted phosphoadenosine phosphosulfate sulfurtransferase